MSLDPSLKSASSLARHRNVLTRAERLERLKEEEKWADNKSVFGLPKVANRKQALAAKPAKEEAAADGATPAAAGAAPAAGAKGAAPAAAKGAAPAGKAAAPAAGGKAAAAPAAKKK